MLNAFLDLVEFVDSKIYRDNFITTHRQRILVVIFFERILVKKHKCFTRVHRRVISVQFRTFENVIFLNEIMR